MKPSERLNITVVGTGYVGLTTALALAYLGHRLQCVDKNPEIVDKLERGISTIYETGLEELLEETRENINFKGSLKECLEETDLLIIAVGTPSKSNGDTDLSYVEEVAREIGANIMPDKPLVVVNKSTVPVGTARRVDTVIKEELEKRQVEATHTVTSNPEFLREGSALHDTLYPDRIVVGSEDTRGVNLLRQMYAPILSQDFVPPKSIPRPEGKGLPALVTTSPTSAELLKYANNSFLALKISFINEIAGLAEKVGADISEVARGIGLDKRIGDAFLNAGVGWGGSCFPKDTRSLIHTASQYGYKLPLTEAAVEVNYRQRMKVIEKLQSTIKVVRGSTVGILGLSFKPETDDIREAPAIDIISELLEMGARVKVYDPVAMDKYKRTYPDQDIIYAASVEQAARDSDAVVLLTDWQQFVHAHWKDIVHTMRQPVFIDGRNLLDPENMRQRGYEYLGIGREAKGQGLHV